MTTRPDLNDLAFDDPLALEYERFLTEVWQFFQIQGGVDPESPNYYNGVQEAFWSHRETGYITF